MGKNDTLDEAALWRVRLETGEADQSAFAAWIDADPDRRAQFAQVDAAWSRFDESLDDPRLRAAASAARSRVIRAGRRRRGARLAVAASLAAVTVASSLFAVSGWETRTYATDQSRMSVELSDGSRMTLDQGSKVRVSYRPWRRQLTLAEGQARFTVAQNKWRPFVVRAGRREVVATGTAFNVDVQEGSVSVALLEGRVKVLDRSRGTPHVPLSPGQQLVVASGRETVTPFDPEVVSDWEAGLTVLNESTLADAVEQMNRHAQTPLVLTAHARAEARISGVFKSGDTAAFAEAISALLPGLSHCPSGREIRIAPRSECGA